MFIGTASVLTMHMTGFVTVIIVQLLLTGMEQTFSHCCVVSQIHHEQISKWHGEWFIPISYQTSYWLVYTQLYQKCNALDR